MTIIQKLRRGTFVFALIAVLTLLCGVAHADGLEVHFMDIDRNDGIVILCNGEAAFIDSGVYGFGLKAVDYMRALGVTHLKYYIGTHAHRDHVGGGAPIILAFSPEAVLQPHAGVGNLIIQCANTQEERAAAEAARYVNVSVGQTYEIGGASLTVLGPLTLRKFTSASDVQENYNSLILRLSYGENSFLLTGDAYASTLADINAANPGALKCDVFKNPHHNGTTKPETLAVTMPQYVVFSTSDKYQPSSTALCRVADIGAKALITSTAQNGHIIFRSDGHALSYTLTKGPDEVSLNKTELSLYEGKQESVTARMKPSQYKAVTYYSLDTSVATVDGSGKITGIAPGTAIVRAVTANGLGSDCVVTVLPISVKLNRDTLTLKHGASDTISATLQPSGTRGKTVAWTSDDPTVAAITSTGKVTGVAPGTTTVRATLQNGTQAVCEVTIEPVAVSGVTVSPYSATLTIGQTQTFTATVSPSNATDQSVVWSSDDESVVSIDQNGLATCVGVGQTKITATASNGKNRAVSVTVKPLYVASIAVAGDRDTILSGVAGKSTVQLAASIQPVDATIQDIEWKTSNARVATVDQNGLVTAVAEGSVTIYAVAKDGSRRQGTYRVTVAANRFERKAAVMEPGRVTVSAKTIRYEGDALRIDLFYANGMTEPVNLPMGGVLTFILPNGRQLPLTPLETGAQTLRRGNVSTYTIRLPLANYPFLTGLDLTACDATVMN